MPRDPLAHRTEAYPVTHERLHPRAANASGPRFGRHHGRDIDGACGQLAVKVVRGGNGCNSSGGGGGGGTNNSGDIEDLVASGSSRANGGSRGRLVRNTSGAKAGGRRKTRGVEDTAEMSVEEAGGVLDASGGWGRPVDRGTLLGGLVLVVGAAAVAVVLVARARRRA